jgi:hypothetical protein
MGLSNENQPQTQTTEDYIFALDRAKVERLSAQLFQGEHNDAHVERELPNPARGVRIRRINPERSRVPVDAECQDHNTAVQSHGTRGKYAR